ncbi:MAG: hypothetical protein OEX77_04545 [Candidatus Bathyarchaeota archaeon]|nr:hypothetical protein [Candidatus Bathyarchaeota archaeon]MDH5733405.1 hypothetical protein [Candidatus Bathyarchaeota archaeon]
MGELVETIRKLREEIEELERGKIALLEKIVNSTVAKGEENVNKLRHDPYTSQKKVTADTPVVARTTNLLRVTIIQRKESDFRY